MARRRLHHSTTTSAPPWHLAFAVPAILILTFLSTPCRALFTVPGSRCDAVCNSADFGTIEEDIVCLDGDYLHTTIGKAYRSCVACGLNSTAVGAHNVTDVDYALYDLRFALSVCMFAYPIQRVSISSPCQVTCQPLSNAIGYALSNTSQTTDPGLGFCTAGQFDDTTINECAFCYGLIPQQVFMANFLQALHVACRQPPVPGQPFFPDAVAIFNESVIAGPSPASSSSGSGSGLLTWQLGLAIGLPAAGGLVLLGLSCFGCFLFTRSRRRRMAESGRMSRLQHAWAGGGSSAGGYSDADTYKAEEHSLSMSGAVNHHYQQQPQMHEMERISPGVQPRHSQHVVGDDDDGEGTPLHSAGPGIGQTQDHHLHDRFFGPDPHDAEEEMPVGQAVPMTPVYGGVEAQQNYQQQQHQHQQEQPQQQQYYPPPPQTRQQHQRHSHSEQDEMGMGIGQASSSPHGLGLAGPSYMERMQQEGQEHLRDERGDWI